MCNKFSIRWKWPSDSPRLNVSLQTHLSSNMWVSVQIFGGSPSKFWKHCHWLSDIIVMNSLWMASGRSVNSSGVNSWRQSQPKTQSIRQRTRRFTQTHSPEKTPVRWLWSPSKEIFLDLFYLISLMLCKLSSQLKMYIIKQCL